MKSPRRMFLVALVMSFIIFAYVISKRDIIVRVPGNTEKISESQNVRVQPVAQIYQYNQHDILDIACLDDGTLWAVGYDGHDPRKIFSSTTGGKTWEARPVKTDGFVLNAIS